MANMLINGVLSEKPKSSDGNFVRMDGDYHDRIEPSAEGLRQRTTTVRTEPEAVVVSHRRDESLPEGEGRAFTLTTMGVWLVQTPVVKM